MVVKPMCAYREFCGWVFCEMYILASALPSPPYRKDVIIHSGASPLPDMTCL